LYVLPIRHGGLGLQNPQETARLEYDNENFTLITTKVIDKIYNQKLDYNSRDHEHTGTIKSKIKQLKDLEYCKCCDKLIEKLDLQAHKRSNKNWGASSWLSAVPIKAIRHTLK